MLSICLSHIHVFDFPKCALKVFISVEGFLISKLPWVTIFGSKNKKAFSAGKIFNSKAKGFGFILFPQNGYLCPIRQYNISL